MNRTKNADDTLSPEDVIWNGADTSVMQDKDIVNLLLIGQDRREGQDRQRADSMIMVTLNKKDQTDQHDLLYAGPVCTDSRLQRQPHQRNLCLLAAWICWTAR